MMEIKIYLSQLKEKMIKNYKNQNIIEKKKN